MTIRSGNKQRQDRERLIICFLRVSGALRAICVTIAVVIASAGVARAENWDRFRGPNGAGQSEAAIPTQWSDANVHWRRPLAGVGHSSPVVWGRRLFVTSADSATGEVIIEAFDAVSGAPLWERRFPSATYSMHAFNSYASTTPAVDADRLYLLWRDGEQLRLAALTHDGQEAWQAEVGTSREKHGFGTSPVVVDDIVCVENDNNSASEIVGVDRASGDVRWRLPRASGDTSFCTPCVLESSGGQKLLIVASNASGVTAIDASSGRVAWHAADDDLPQRCVASPVVAGGLVFVTCGQGGNGLHLLAVRPPANGAGAEEVYRVRQGIPQVPTPIAAGDLLFLWHDGGTVSCLDVATGQPHWRQRVGGNYHGSPVRVGDRIFCVSAEGDVHVLAARPTFQLLAKNSLGEPSRATPAVANDRMYLRTESSLICIGEPVGKN